MSYTRAEVARIIFLMNDLARIKGEADAHLARLQVIEEAVALAYSQKADPELITSLHALKNKFHYVQPDPIPIYIYQYAGMFFIAKIDQLGEVLLLGLNVEKIFWAKLENALTAKTHNLIHFQDQEDAVYLASRLAGHCLFGDSKILAIFGQFVTGDRIVALVSSLPKQLPSRITLEPRDVILCAPDIDITHPISFTVTEWLPALYTFEINFKEPIS